MDALVPAPIVVTLTAAASLSIVSAVASRRVLDATSIAASGVAAVICFVLLVRATGEPIVYWFGDWSVRGDIVLGISFVIDPLGAGMAALAAVLVAAALLYSWRYFEAVGALYHVLMLVMLAGMLGVCLTGDLFNLFVFFEIMSVTAFALTGYQVDESAPLQGSLSFAVTNTVGALFILWGIGLLYGRTGTLNLAALGDALAGGEVDALVIAAFALLVCGFLIKAAIVPFHFWLTDAYAAAPAAVCVIFAGVLSELGLYSLARTYWTVFADAFAQSAPALRGVFVALGVVTAVTGAVMMIPQHHLMRSLAFAVVAHSGLFLVGIGLLTPTGIAGAGLYLVADGIVKAVLYMSVGMLEHRLAGVDERTLHGRGRGRWVMAALMVFGALALAGLPPIGTFIGKGLIEEEAAHLGYGWIGVVFIATSALTAGVWLRACGRIFWGWGSVPSERDDPTAQRVGVETEPQERKGEPRVPAAMAVPAVALALTTLGWMGIPALTGAVEAASDTFTDSAAYRRAVLEGDVRPLPATHAGGPKSSAYLHGVIATLLAVGVAGAALGRGGAARGVRRLADRGRPALSAVRAVHSGNAADYVAWIVAGIAALGGLFALAVA